MKCECTDLQVKAWRMLLALLAWLFNSAACASKHSTLTCLALNSAACASTHSRRWWRLLVQDSTELIKLNYIKLPPRACLGDLLHVDHVLGVVGAGVDDLRASCNLRKNTCASTRLTEAKNAQRSSLFAVECCKCTVCRRALRHAHIGYSSSHAARCTARCTALPAAHGGASRVVGRVGGGVVSYLQRLLLLLGLLVRHEVPSARG